MIMTGMDDLAGKEYGPGDDDDDDHEQEGGNGQVIKTGEEDQKVAQVNRIREKAAKVLERRGKGGAAKAKIKGQNEKKGVNTHTVYKYSTDIPLAEEILLGNENVFLQIVDNGNKPKISTTIDLSQEKRIVLKPHEHGVISPIIPYQFKDVTEIEFFIKQAKNETIDSLYFMSKSLWKKFVVADNEQLTLIAADSTYTFFQDGFATTHYTMIVGPPGSGKGAILVGFKYLGYRVVLASDMSGANLLDLLGSLEAGQVVIAEDELDDIDDDKDKKRLYKVGYDRHGPIPRTLDGNTSSRNSRWYHTYGYKLFAAEGSTDSSSMEGFNDRTFKMRTIKGKPLFYVKELMTPKESKKYHDIISKVTYFRKMMLIYRMLHHKDPIKDVKTNLDGRPLELTGPQICLFSTPSLTTKDFAARNEILPVLSSFLRQKGELTGRTIEAVIYSVVLELFDDPEIKKNTYLEARVDGSTHTCYNIKNSDLCEAVRIAVDGYLPVVTGNQQQQSSQAFYCAEFDKVTHKTILKRCRDRLMAVDISIGTGKDKTRGLKFSREEVTKAGSVFEVISEIKILQDDDDDDEQQNRTAIENDEERVLWQGWNEYIDNSGGNNHNNNNDSTLSDSNNLGTMGRKYPSGNTGLSENIAPHETTEQDENANLATDRPQFANKSQQTTCNDVNTSNNEQAPFCMDTDVQNSKTSFPNEQKIVPTSHVLQTMNIGKEEQIPQHQEEKNPLQPKFQDEPSTNSKKDSIEEDEKEREELLHL